MERNLENWDELNWQYDERIRQACKEDTNSDKNRVISPECGGLEHQGHSKKKTQIDEHAAYKKLPLLHQRV